MIGNVNDQQQRLGQAASGGPALAASLGINADYRHP